jgi:two-component system phosphate regulon response regulator PhoB
MSHSIFVIHPEQSIRDAARRLLEPVGFEVDEARELRFSDLPSPDVLLVAWATLGPVDKALHWLRNQDSTRQSRIILIVSRADMCEAIGALEQGADDCVAEPFETQELLVRINVSLHRPASARGGERLRAGPVVLDRQVHAVSVYERNVELAPTEFRLMAFLLEHQGRVFSRKELLNRALSANVKAGHRTVDVYVRRLRQQLERFGCQNMIQTVRGFGYRLRAEDEAMPSPTRRPQVKSVP